MAMFTTEQIRYEINRHAPKTHPQEAYQKWDDIDEVIARDHEIRLPEIVNDAEGKSLERLHTRTNYAKVVIHSTVTMVLASGLKVYNDEGLIEEGAEKRFDMKLIRRLIRYMSQYGAAWILRRPNDKFLPFRVYKPHIAREIPLETDPEIVKAVLAIEELQKRAKDAEEDQTYHVARWYEWVDTEGRKTMEPSQWSRVERRVFISENAGGEWREDMNSRASYSYMPMKMIRNHDSDTIYEASDVIDGLELFKGLDDLTTKFIKALEDEAWRQTFFANVTADQIKDMKNVGALNLMFADNGAEGPEPRPYWADPADHTQYLEAFKDFMKRIATTTRTSPLELDERPVQDIPAQTLRVLYGPQIERCNETAEYAGRELSELRALINEESFDPMKKSRVELKPVLPISEDKRHQNAKGLLDSDAFSRVKMLMEDGYPREEAERIVAEALEEKRRIAQIETDMEMQVEEKRGETQESLEQIRAETQVRVAKERPAPSSQ